MNVARERIARLLTPFGLAAFALLAATNARASESYPRALEQALETPCPPDCTTCHTRPSGGLLTANTPVGISMRRAGLKGGETSTLFDALATLEADGTDSDMDGVPDVDEMRAGTNPNAAGGKLKCWEPEPEPGCAIARRSLRERRGSTAPSGAGLVVAAFALGFVLRRGRACRLSRCSVSGSCSACATRPTSITSPP